MMDNLNTYSFANNVNLCDFNACFNVASGALTTGTLSPQTGQIRDGGYTPPPVTTVYTPQEIDGVDSLSFDSYLSEASTVSVNLSTTSTCVNVATGYDLFNFGYQLLIREHGQILNREGNFNYNNTLGIVCSSSFTTNWRILSSNVIYNKILSGTSIDLLPVGSYRRTTSPSDILTVNYYTSTDYVIPPPFWTGELLNVYTTNKTVWDMFSIRLGGEDLKNTYNSEKVNKSIYIVDQPRDLSQYTINDYLSTRVDLTLSGVQIGNTVYDSDIKSGDNFGSSVDTNDDGTRIVVGSSYYTSTIIDAGLVRVYQLIDSNWIKIGQDIVGAKVNDYFGISVSMSGDGNRISIGSRRGPNDTGATRIYELIDNQWIQIGQSIIGQSSSDQSGYYSVLNSLGNRIAVVEREAVGGRGRVRVYEYDGLLWVQMGQAISGNLNNDSIYTAAINTTGDIIAYGSPGSDVAGFNTGLVRAYKWNGTDWYQIGQDVYGDDSHRLLGSYSLSLNGAGDIFAVSAVGGDGSALVYKYNGTSWELLVEFTGYGFTSYGYSISLNTAGDRIAIGHPLRHGNNIGAVEVYENNNFYWEKIIVDIIGPANQTVGQSTYFGASVALNKNGDRLTVGAPLISGGQVRNYQLPQYPLTNLSSYNVYKSVMLWADGEISENPFIYPFYLPDGTYGSSAGVINFRKFTSPGEYTIVSNTFYYKNSLNKEIALTEPYNITFVVSD